MDRLDKKTGKKNKDLTGIQNYSRKKYTVLIGLLIIGEKNACQKNGKQLVSIHKKEAQQNCENCGGITLLHISYKILWIL